MVFSSVAQMSIKEVTFPSQREREMKQVFERFMLLQILSLKFIINKQHVSKLKSRSKKKKFFILSMPLSRVTCILPLFTGTSHLHIHSKCAAENHEVSQEGKFLKGYPNNGRISVFSCFLCYERPKQKSLHFPENQHICRYLGIYYWKLTSMCPQKNNKKKAPVPTVGDKKQNNFWKPPAPILQEPNTRWFRYQSDQHSKQIRWHVSTTRLTCGYLNSILDLLHKP